MLNDEVVNSFLSEVPSEVFDAIKPLSDRNNKAIFVALLKKDKMRFGQLKELFKTVNSEDINHPLKSLVKAGIVSKKAEYLGEIGKTEIAVYQPSFLGRSVMRSLYKGVMLGIDNIPTAYPQKSVAVMGDGGLNSYFASNGANKVEPRIIEQSVGGYARSELPLVRSEMLAPNEG